MTRPNELTTRWFLRSKPAACKPMITTRRTVNGKKWGRPAGAQSRNWWHMVHRGQPVLVMAKDEAEAGRLFTLIYDLVRQPVVKCAKKYEIDAWMRRWSRKKAAVA